MATTICFIYFLFYLFIFGHTELRAELPWPGIDPAPPTAKRRILTTGSPGTSSHWFYWRGLKKGKKVPTSIGQWFSKHSLAIQNEGGCCITWERVKRPNDWVLPKEPGGLQSLELHSRTWLKRLSSCTCTHARTHTHTHTHTHPDLMNQKLWEWGRVIWLQGLLMQDEVHEPLAPGETWSFGLLEKVLKITVAKGSEGEDRQEIVFKLEVRVASWQGPSFLTISLSSPSGMWAVNIWGGKWAWDRMEKEVLGPQTVLIKHVPLWD